MKKLITLSLMLCCLSAITYSQNVAINTDGSQPDASAALDIKSSNKGMLVPRVTSAQRTAIASPATGLLVYDVTTNSFWFYNGSAWTNLASGGSFSLPYYGATSATDTGFHIRQTGTYAAIAAHATQGAGVTGISSTGSGIEGASTSGAGVYGNSVSGAGVNAFSSNGFGIIANSINSSSLYAYNNNAYPAINAVNNNAVGIAVNGSSSASNAIVGASAGTAKAGIRGEATGNGGNGVFGTTTSATGNAVYGNTTSGTGVYGFSTSGTGVKAFSGSGLALDVNGDVKISGGTVAPSAGAVLTSDANGNASWQNNKIAFRIYGLNLNYDDIKEGAYTRVQFGTKQYDYGNNYTMLAGIPSAASSVFTAPKAGVYHFDTKIGFAYLNSGTYEMAFIDLMLTRNGVDSHLASTGFPDLDMPYIDMAISTDVKLQAGDKVWVQGFYFGSADANSTFSDGYFSGHLIFAD